MRGKNKAKIKSRSKTKTIVGSENEMPESMVALLKKQQYEIAGKHSVVKICHWTKKSIKNQGTCYKEKFYGIRAHRCCQMSPSAGFCPNQCLYCWRDMEHTLGQKIKGKTDNPKDIIKRCIEGQRKLLVGFFGNDKADKKKLKEAMDPKHFAISLTGEPTAYNKISELISELHKQKKTTFLVTNGQYPEVIKDLELPTQLYVSVSAPNEKLFLEVVRPKLKDAWKRLQKTLEILPHLDTRKVIRITLIKGITMVDSSGYANMIKKSRVHMVEIKAYMFVGGSRQRMSLDNMPRHEEIVDFAKKICKKCNFKILDEQPASRVVLIAESDFPGRIMKF